MSLVDGRSYVLVVLSAGLQAVIFPISGPLSRWAPICSWVALVPLVVVIFWRRETGVRLRAWQAAILGYLCGVLWYAANCAWIYQTMYLYGGMAKPVAVLILILFALYLGLYHALFAFLLWCCARSRYGISLALGMAPFLWVAVELARARITGFPWDLLGYSQVDNMLLTQIAPVGGVMAMSFAIAAVNALVAGAVLCGGRTRIMNAAGALTAIFLFNAGSFLPGRPEASAEDQSAVLLQSDLSVGVMASQERPLSGSQEVHDFSLLSLSGIREAARGTPALVVWPEAPSHLRSSDKEFRDSMGELARTARAPLIIGSLGVDFDRASPRGYFLYDSASFFSSGGEYAGRYDKIHLVPWGEYIPFKQFFSFAEKLTEGAGDMDRGGNRTVFTTQGHAYGVFICYESIFGNEVRHFVANGAEVLVNISDDGWYGDTGAPWQHLNMARMRAIENHRWLLRDTNTGVTAAIDPSGRVVDPAPRHIRGAFSVPFAFEQAASLTFYTRHGDWFAWICVLVTVLGLMFSTLQVAQNRLR